MLGWMVRRRPSDDLSSGGPSPEELVLFGRLEPGTPALLVADGHRSLCTVGRPVAHGDDRYPDVPVGGDSSLPSSLVGELHCSLSDGLLVLSGEYHRQPDGRRVFFTDSCRFHQRRGFVRTRMLLEAEVVLPDGSALPARTVDLSGAGVQLHGSGLASLSPESMVRVVVHLGDGSSISVPGVVVRTVEGDRVCLEFRDLSPVLEDRICGLVFQHQVSHLH